MARDDFLSRMYAEAPPETLAELAKHKEVRGLMVQVVHAYVAGPLAEEIEKCMTACRAIAPDMAHVATIPSMVILHLGGALVAQQVSMLKLAGKSDPKEREEAMRATLERVLEYGIARSDKLHDNHGRELRPDGTPRS
jgi:hypothetical protein